MEKIYKASILFFLMVLINTRNSFTHDSVRVFNLKVLKVPYDSHMFTHGIMLTHGGKCLFPFFTILFPFSLFIFH